MIKISKIGLYAIKSVLYIAKNNENLVKIKDISKSENISESLLRRIISSLEKNSIIETTKGRNGGVKIIKDYKNISLYEILLSVGEELSITDCTSGNFCENKNICSTTNIFNDLQKGFNFLLKMNTIDKILKK